MNKTEVYKFLEDKSIEYKAYEHRAVFTVEEADALQLPDPEAGTKNLFLRDQKKQNYYLLTVRDHLPVRIKDFQKKIGARPLSFASEEDLNRILGLIKGSVTPFGLLNDPDKCVKFYLDEYFRDRVISAHPNENTATVFLKADDLMKLLEENGNSVSWIGMEEPDTLLSEVIII